MREGRPISGRGPRGIFGRPGLQRPYQGPAAHSFVNEDGGIQALGDEVLTELLTIAAAATTDTSIQIPANSWVNSVSALVTVVIPTATTFDHGISGATTRYGSATSVAATTFAPGTIDGRRYYASATAIRITPDNTPAANTGRVLVTIHYNKGS